MTLITEISVMVVGQKHIFGSLDMMPRGVECFAPRDKTKLTLQTIALFEAFTILSFYIHNKILLFIKYHNFYHSVALKQSGEY